MRKNRVSSFWRPAGVSGEPSGSRIARFTCETQLFWQSVTAFTIGDASIVMESRGDGVQRDDENYESLVFLRIALLRPSYDQASRAVKGVGNLSLNGVEFPGLTRGKTNSRRGRKTRQENPYFKG